MVRTPPPILEELTINAREFGDLKRRIERGDPIAIYEAILLCKGAKVEMPAWLADELMKVIADLHLGNKPSWRKKKGGIRPLFILRRRIETDVKRRAVASVRAWQKDKSAYAAMPRKSIEAWYKGIVDHKTCRTFEDALELAKLGIEGLSVLKDGPTIRCSTRTLRRAHENKSFQAIPPTPSDIAKVFGLIDPDHFFGIDEPPPLHLLE